jgi:hypothetical protein
MRKLWQCLTLVQFFPFYFYQPSSVMDNSPFISDQTEISTLSYDDTVVYEEQLPSSNGANTASLANRIGSTKVYLLPESVTKVGKVRR